MGWLKNLIGKIFKKNDVQAIDSPKGNDVSVAAVGVELSDEVKDLFNQVIQELESIGYDKNQITLIKQDLNKQLSDPILAQSDSQKIYMINTANKKRTEKMSQFQSKIESIKKEHPGAEQQWYIFDANLSFNEEMGQPINLQARIDKAVQALQVVGYGPEEIEKQKKSLEDKVKGMKNNTESEQKTTKAVICTNIMTSLEYARKKAKELDVQKESIRGKGYSKEKEEELIAQEEASFLETMGHKIDLNSILEKTKQELETAGYKKEQIDFIMEGINKKLGESWVRDSRVKFSIVYGKKGEMVEKMNQFQSQIEGIKQLYNGEEQERRLTEAKLDFDESLGAKINFQARVDIAIKDLQAAGYGPIEIEAKKKKINEIINDSGSNEKTKLALVKAEIGSSIAFIQKKRTDLEKKIDFLNNPENLDEAELAMSDLEEGSDSRKTYLRQLMDNKIKSEQTKFAINMGHDKNEEYVNLRMQSLKLHYCSDKVCEEVSKKIMANTAGLQQGKFTSAVDMIVDSYISRNKTDILDYNCMQGYMKIIAEKLQITPKSLTLDLLGCTNDELESYHKKIDASECITVKDSDEIVNFSVIKASTNFVRTNPEFNTAVLAKKGMEEKLTYAEVEAARQAMLDRDREQGLGDK